MKPQAEHPTSKEGSLLVLNQMAGPMTRELIEDLADRFGTIELFTGHPDTLQMCRHPRIRLIAAPAYQRGSHFHRLWSWARYLVSAFFWLWSHSASHRVLVFSNPPLAAGMLAWMKRWRGTRYAVMVHDIYPDVLIRQGIIRENGLVASGWRRWNRWAYGAADLVMTLGDHMQKVVSRDVPRQSTQSQPVEVIPPWGDCRQLHPIPRQLNPFSQKHGIQDELILMYSGNMGNGHDLESIWEVAERLDRKVTKVRFLMIGAGPKWLWLQARLAECRLDNMLLLPWQEEAGLGAQLSTADLGLVSQEAELTGLAIPSKAFYFLAAGVPLLGICEQDTELADTIHRFKCGMVVGPRSPHAIERIVRDLLADREQLLRWKEGARHAARYFDRPRMTGKIGDLLQDRLNLQPLSQPRECNPNPAGASTAS